MAGVMGIAAEGEDTAVRTAVAAADAPGGAGHATSDDPDRGTIGVNPASRPASRRRSSTATAT
jgi:hypothetical protein